MFNKEKIEDNLLLVDSDSEIYSPYFFQKNDLYLKTEEEFKLNKKEIKFRVKHKKDISKKKEVKNLNSIENNCDINKKFISNNKNDNSLSIKFETINTNINQLQTNSSEKILYRKDAYYKHFKVILGNYIKNKINKLKNKCFPYYSKNNFSTPSYKYIGNPKEKDNFYFLSYTIKEILIYGKDKLKYNRQYNNELLIKFIEDNDSRVKDKDSYNELIYLLNDKLKNVIIQFYDDKIEFDKLNNDSKCIQLDVFYKRETGISLLNKYGFLEALKQFNK